jgi:DNA polymerase
MNDDIRNTVIRILETEKLSGMDEILLPHRDERRHLLSDLDSLRKEVSGCRKCGELVRTRKNIVFGEGNPSADLMFVGEAPGAEEDKKGVPFVGRAGRLLDKIIKAIGLERDQVFIGNVLKCRPPGNRNPEPSEMAACSPYLMAQILLIQPKVICTLGKFASQVLLETETPISRLRGSFHDFKGIKLMPTYHPAYLLRNPGAKKLVWEDMKIIAGELGLDIHRRDRAET